jgi:hypothetical protein
VFRNMSSAGGPGDAILFFFGTAFVLDSLLLCFNFFLYFPFFFFFLFFFFFCY